MNLCMLVIAVGVVMTAMEWQLKTALFPLVMGMAAFFMSLAELLLSLFGSEEGAKKQSGFDFKLSEDVDKSLVLRRTLLTSGWIIGFFLFILLFGFLVQIIEGRRYS